MTNVKLNILKPGLLVSLQSRVHGGVAYTRKDLDPNAGAEEGAQVKRWETEKVVHNVEEFERATKARSAARSAITSICSPSMFGLLCPADQQDKLDDAIYQARRIASNHNADATHTKVDVFVIVGRIAQTDEEAARAISNELMELMEQMKTATLAGDVAKIREAANKARDLGQILSADVGQKVTAAIDEARKNARELVKRIEKDGEKAADVIKTLYTQKMDTARSAFLDLDAGEVKSVAHQPAQLEV